MSVLFVTIRSVEMSQQEDIVRRESPRHVMEVEMVGLGYTWNDHRTLVLELSRYRSEVLRG
jgi:hypothetical protein